MALKNYYDLLGISPAASQDDIKKAYRKLSLKFHPDKNDGDAFLMDMFKTINEANEILSDPNKRREYDNKLKSAEEVKSRRDVNQPEWEQAKNFNAYSSDSEPNPRDEARIQKVYDLWDLYLKKKAVTDKAYRNMVHARSYDVPQYVTTKRVLSSLLALLLVWLLFKPTKYTSAATTDNTTYEWVTNKTANVYKKPSNKSRVVSELPVGKKLHAVDETTYFIKIEFANGDGSTSTGYVMKSSLIRI